MKALHMSLPKNIQMIVTDCKGGVPDSMEAGDIMGEEGMMEAEGTVKIESTMDAQSTIKAEAGTSIGDGAA